MRTAIFVTLLFSVICGYAQRPLEYENQSRENEVYALGRNTYTRVTISADKDMQPLFNSMQTWLTPVETEILNDLIHHHVHINTRNPMTRNLQVSISGFTPLNIDLGTPQPNQWLRYHVFDPDITVVDCFNQLMREGDSFFRSGMYEDARIKYESIKIICSQVDDEDRINRRIAQIDSILMWFNLGEIDFARSNYIGFIEHFGKIFRENPGDDYIRNRITEVRLKIIEDCRITFRLAENYFDARDFTNAMLLYERVVANSCTESALALEKMHDIRARMQRQQVFVYEFSKNTPIGFSTGSYRRHRSGGYFSMRFSPNVFELLRSEKTDSIFLSELNVSFGWTIRTIYPVWLFFTPFGYTGILQYEDWKVGAERFTYFQAWSPEAGILAKIPLRARMGIALRYTLQYRVPIGEVPMSGNNEGVRHIFGVGFHF